MASAAAEAEAIVLPLEEDGVQYVARKIGLGALADLLDGGAVAEEVMTAEESEAVAAETQSIQSSNRDIAERWYRKYPVGSKMSIRRFDSEGRKLDKIGERQFDDAIKSMKEYGLTPVRRPGVKPRSVWKEAVSGKTPAYSGGDYSSVEGKGAQQIKMSDAEIAYWNRATALDTGLYDFRNPSDVARYEAAEAKYPIDEYPQMYRIWKDNHQGPGRIFLNKMGAPDPAYQDVLVANRLQEARLLMAQARAKRVRVIREWAKNVRAGTKNPVDADRIINKKLKWARLKDPRVWLALVATPGPGTVAAGTYIGSKFIPLSDTNSTSNLPKNAAGMSRSPGNSRGRGYTQWYNAFIRSLEAGHVPTSSELFRYAQPLHGGRRPIGPARVWIDSLMRGNAANARRVDDRRSSNERRRYGKHTTGFGKQSPLERNLFKGGRKAHWKKLQYGPVYSKRSYY